MRCPLYDGYTCTIVYLPGTREYGTSSYVHQLCGIRQVMSVELSINVLKCCCTSFNYYVGFGFGPLAKRRKFHSAPLAMAMFAPSLQLPPHHWWGKYLRGATRWRTCEKGKGAGNASEPLPPCHPAGCLFWLVGISLFSSTATVMPCKSHRVRHFTFYGRTVIVQQRARSARGLLCLTWHCLYVIGWPWREERTQPSSSVDAMRKM